MPYMDSEKEDEDEDEDEDEGLLQLERQGGRQLRSTWGEWESEFHQDTLKIPKQNI